MDKFIGHENQSKMFKDSIDYSLMSLKENLLRYLSVSCDTVEEHTRYKEQLDTQAERKNKTYKTMREEVIKIGAKFPEDEFIARWTALSFIADNIASYISRKTSCKFPSELELDEYVAKVYQEFRHVLAKSILAQHETNLVPLTEEHVKELTELVTKYEQEEIDPDLNDWMTDELDGKLDSFIDFYLYVPWSYDPISGIEQITTMPCLTMLPKLVTDIITGQEINERNALRTVYNTYMSEVTYHANISGVQQEYVYSSNSKLVKKSDVVTVYNIRNKIEYRDVYVEEAKKRYQYNPDNERYYNFDYASYPFYVIGMGFVNQETLDNDSDIQHEPAYNCYIKGRFRVLNYSADVLDFFDGFNTMPYETYVKGSKRKSDNTLFMGMELEVERSRKATMDSIEIARQSVLALKQHAIAVYDGSIGEGGFELVSVPCTLAYHYSVWEDLLRGELRKQLVSYNRSSCGIHIHMNKDSFTDIGMGKFTTFITSTANRKFIETIAQRKANSYNQYQPTKVSKIAKMKQAQCFVAEDGNRIGKYSAVNMNKDHTVEVRIFKGTLHYPSVMKNLEFCHALHAFCHGHAGVTTMGYEQFVSWLTDPKKGNRKAYPNLFNYLKANGYITEEKALPVRNITKEDLTDDMVASGVNEEITDQLPKDVQHKMQMLVASRASGVNYTRIQNKAYA